MGVVLPSALTPGLYQGATDTPIYTIYLNGELCRCLIVLFLVLVTKALGPKQFQLPFRPQDDLLARAMAQGPKTVDVPASLPTPPHNNQEELRWVFPDIFKTVFGADSMMF